VAQDLIDMLVDAGFERVSVVEKEESKEFIKDWLPGSGAEDYVVSANVTAYKACTSGDGALSDADLYEDDAKSSLKAVAADAFASAAGVERSAAAPIGEAVAALVAAVGAVVRAIGAHHAEHTDVPGEVNCCADVDCEADDVPKEVKKSC
jgi:arsenite methyltransferase|tara:strand:- start:868 stop:1317 length:450 start_codon:yes stop_codon:yes gene_type:complete